MFVRAPAFALVVVALVAMCSANVSEDATAKAAALTSDVALAPASGASAPAVLTETSLQTVERRKRRRRYRRRRGRYGRRRRNRRRYGRKRRYRRRYGHKRYHRRKSYDDYDYDYGSHSKDDYYYKQYPEGCDSRCYPGRSGCPSHCALSSCGGYGSYGGGAYRCVAKVGANAPLCGGRCVNGQAALVAQCGAGTCMPAPCPQPGYYFCLPKPVAQPTNANPCGAQVCYTNALSAGNSCPSPQCQVRPCRTTGGGSGYFCGAAVASVCGDICVNTGQAAAQALCRELGCATARCDKGIGFKCVEVLAVSPSPSTTPSATPSNSPPAVMPTATVPGATPTTMPTNDNPPSPSVTPTPSGTPGESPTPTPTASASPSATASTTPSATASPSTVASVSPTPSPTPSPGRQCPNCFIEDPNNPLRCINDPTRAADCDPCDANRNGFTGTQLCQQSGLPSSYQCCPQDSVCIATTYPDRFDGTEPLALICTVTCGETCLDNNQGTANACVVGNTEIALEDADDSDGSVELQELEVCPDISP